MGLSVHGFFDQAVDVGIEAGELLVEHSGELQVFDDGLVETFAGNQQRDAGRVGCQQHGGRCDPRDDQWRPGRSLGASSCRRPAMASSGAASAKGTSRW